MDVYKQFRSKLRISCRTFRPNTSAAASTVSYLVTVVVSAPVHEPSDG